MTDTRKDAPIQRQAGMEAPVPELTGEDMKEFEAFRTFREAAGTRIREALGPRRDLRNG
jgi:hypothetical protein